MYINFKQNLLDKMLLLSKSRSVTYNQHTYLETIFYILSDKNSPDSTGESFSPFFDQAKYGKVR
jgi:hypothetical protein